MIDEDCYNPFLIEDDVDRYSVFFLFSVLLKTSNRLKEIRVPLIIQCKRSSYTVAKIFYNMHVKKYGIGCVKLLPIISMP